MKHCCTMLPFHIVHCLVERNGIILNDIETIFWTCTVNIARNTFDFIVVLFNPLWVKLARKLGLLHIQTLSEGRINHQPLSAQVQTYGWAHVCMPYTIHRRRRYLLRGSDTRAVAECTRMHPRLTTALASHSELILRPSKAGRGGGGGTWATPPPVPMAMHCNTF